MIMILIIIIAEMTPSSSDHDNERLVAGRLAERGNRYTTARRLVVRSLTASTGPLSAAELLTSLGGQIPLSSIYRTLVVLEKAEVLTKQHDNNGIARYELAEWLAGHHHHLVCTKCGEVHDVVIDPETEKRVASLIDYIADDAGYVVSGHRVDIEGECSECVKS